MYRNTYTLPELVDLALRIPEVGQVNFNIIYTVLQTIISESQLTEVRPLCRLENVTSARAALTDAKLHRMKKSKSQKSVTIKDVETMAPAFLRSPSGKGKKGLDDQKDQKDEIEDKISKELVNKEFRTANLGSNEPEFEDIASDEEEDNKPPQENIKPSSAFKMGGVLQTVLMSNIDCRLEALEEVVRQLSEVTDRITMELGKKLGKRSGNGEVTDEILDLIERVDDISEELQNLGNDSKLLAELRKKYNELLKEFKDVKASVKAGYENTKKFQDDFEKMIADMQTLMQDFKKIADSKVDYYEYEAAIDNMGEALCKQFAEFRKKTAHFAAQNTEVWNELGQKLDKLTFEDTVRTHESKMVAMAETLTDLSKIVTDMLYPDSCGVASKCLACKRPAGITRWQLEYATKAHITLAAGDKDATNKKGSLVKRTKVPAKQGTLQAKATTNTARSGQRSKTEGLCLTPKTNAKKPFGNKYSALPPIGVLNYKATNANEKSTPKGAKYATA